MATTVCGPKLCGPKQVRKGYDRYNSQTHLAPVFERRGPLQCVFEVLVVYTWFWPRSGRVYLFWAIFPSVEAETSQQYYSTSSRRW